MNLFGKAKKKPTTKESIMQLQETLEMLQKREKHLQKKIDNELRIAKENAHKNKRLALMALKRKKTYEGQITKIEGARMTLESQVMAIENANVGLEAMKAMKKGATTMKSIHQNMSIDDVDKTMDEIRDQMDVADEISNVIAQPIGPGMDFDEDELAAELDALEQDALDDQFLEVGTSSKGKTKRRSSSREDKRIDLPDAPTGEVTAEEEDELKALQAEIAM